MASTPEGKVKAAVKRVLDRYAVYSFWPVQTGMGARTLDCLGAHYGRAFAIECKAPGKKPTPLQTLIIRDMEYAGMTVFVVASADVRSRDLERLEKWLKEGIGT